MLIQSSPGGGGTSAKETLPALWIAEYKARGEEGYSYNNLNVRAKMFQSASAVNDLKINGESLEFILTEESMELISFSDWLKMIWDLVEYHHLFVGIETIEQVINNEELMTCIETSPTARAAIAGSRAAMVAVSTSQVAKDMIINSANFMNAMAKSKVAMEVIVNNESFISQISQSTIAMEAIANNKIAMNITANSQIAMRAINESAIAV